ncbi:hypothetical protein CRE_14287 [Caenorhabditis remanei]|uniref:Uncharacterized protein n=1 Tax=Caenorhabditis remanei TaxID=31234 RepID=E3NBT9_CAERE|nr:hypothetical protein CRE_14287 [Caenorhabditis remanei]
MFLSYWLYSAPWFWQMSKVETSKDHATMTAIVTAFVGMRATNLVIAAVGEELAGVTHKVWTQEQCWFIEFQIS